MLIGRIDDLQRMTELSPELQSWGQRLREEGQRYRDMPGRTEYPRELKAEIVQFVAAARAEGIAGIAIGRELGMAAATFQPWISKLQSGATSPLREVRVKDGTRGSGLILVMPGGARIEGFSIAAVAELIRALR